MKRFINTIALNDVNSFYFHSLHKNERIQKKCYLNGCQHTFTIYLLIQGHEKVLIEEGVFSMNKGDVFLISKQKQFTSLISPGHHEYLMINFNIGKILSTFQKQVKVLETMFFNSDPFIKLNDTQLSKIMNNMFDIYLSFNKYPKIRKLHVINGFLAILFILYDVYKYDNTYVNSASDEIPTIENTILKVKSYIEENYKHNLSLSILSKQAGISPEYLSREFKKETGYNISHYIQKVRLSHTCYMLEHTALPITEICFLSGFSSISQFNRTFKKHMGLSPSKFRKSIIKTKIT